MTHQHNEQTRTPLSGGALVAEAAVLLVAARVAIATCSHASIVRYLCSPLHLDASPVEKNKARGDVQRAIRRVCALLPNQFVCYPRALAAHAMLRRRGCATQLYFGVPADADEPPHAWLQDGSDGVIGMAKSQGYAPVVAYGPLMSQVLLQPVEASPGQRS